jgi:hypothetical protein
MISAQLFNAVHTERFSSDDVQNVVSVISGGLDISILAPNGTYYHFDSIPAPVSPYTASIKLIVTKGCTMRFTPTGGASFWIDR